MTKKIFVLNISSEPDLIYVYEGRKISKQRSVELSKKYDGKIKFITKELTNVRIYNPDSPRNRLEGAILDLEVNESNDDEIKELILGL